MGVELQSTIFQLVCLCLFSPLFYDLGKLPLPIGPFNCRHVTEEHHHRFELRLRVAH